MPDIWGLAAIATKFLLYLGVLSATGTALATLIFGLNRTRTRTLGFAGLGVAATLLSFSLKGANLTGDASGMTDPEMLGLLWGTPVGSAVSLRMMGLGVLIAGLFLGRTGHWISAAGGIAALMSFNVIGHIQAKDMVTLNLVLTLHLVAVAFWIGILTPLKRLTLDPGTYGQAADLGHRFGKIATTAIPALIVAGGTLGYHLVGSFDALVGTSYGQALIVKILAVAVLLTLGAANKFRLVPRLRSGDAQAARQLGKSIWAEWVLIAIILATTAVLTTNLQVPT